MALVEYLESVKRIPILEDEMNTSDLERLLLRINVTRAKVKVSGRETNVLTFVSISGTANTAL